ncbi:MAG: hypothetical protein RQ761_03280 [Bacteroidales bacterium]|nr:hypothetical protein [Bacteroidales bacterium]
MKTNNLLLMLLTLVFMLSSCREIDVKTIVNIDGSFKRVITLRGDSADVLKKDLPYPVSDAWQKEFFRDTTEENVFICRYTRSYENDDQLNAEINSDTSWRKKINRHVEVSKQFMFFYSFVTYKEVYKAANPVQSLDHRDYLNSGQLDYLSGRKIPLNKSDSVEMNKAEDRAEEYFIDALTLEVIQTLKDGLNKLEDPELKQIDPAQYKDSIAAKAADWAPEELEKYIDALASWTGRQEVKRLTELEPPIFDELNKKIRFFESLLMAEEFSVEVQMPGLITATNSNEMVGNTVSWNVQNMSFFFEDYEMAVESRVVNYWAFYLGGAVLLLLLIAMIIRIFK